MQQNRNDPVTIPFFTRLVATGLFAGYSPIVPGTAGSLVGVGIYAIPGMETPVVLSLATLAVLFLGANVSGRMEKKLGEDPQIIVIDEIIGMWISLLFLPKRLLVVLIAFILFRIYDTFKPPPARQLERVGHGWGVMLDDVAAGVYANLTVRLILVLFSGIM